MAKLTVKMLEISLLTGNEELDKFLEIGADPHGAMCTGTGHTRDDVEYDPAAPAEKMTLTQEEQDILDGKKGEVLAKVMKTVVAYGEWISEDIRTRCSWAVRPQSRR